ncbi:class A beta-lactamase-related serine hydrolase [Flavobacteriaceae bacterium AU392]|nr:class A beta-lactamase-related serine hydrolase [Flavobacteriaceae bacterium]RKM85595.1 class A beta-lactamase-related serine hydrolase [Flavobacteriaceae bacterium AU392]
MKNSHLITIFILTVFFTACHTKHQETDTNKPKYETYNYTGFTKEEKYAFHKHIYEGGNWTVHGDKERYFYLNSSEIMNYSRIVRSDTPKILEETPRDDVKNFIVPTDLKKGGGLSLNDYVQQVEVNGLIIIHKGKIVFEGYPRMFPTDLHTHLIMTQVFVSTAIAILEDRGLIDTSKSIDHYFDILKDSGWKGVPIADILSMSSGIDRPLTLVNHFERFDLLKDLATAKKSVHPPGTKFQPSNLDAAMLTLLVEKISGLAFRDFLEQEIWKKIGSEYSALLGISKNGVSLSYLNGLSSTLRDLGRFGLAFTPSGRKGKSPIISDAHLSKIWNVNENLKKASRTSRETYYSNYQWSAVYEDGDLYKGAHGGQGLYISPSKDLVIAYFGTANIDRERNQLSIISRQLSKSGLFDLE